MQKRKRNKMHFDFITRGEKSCVERFANELASKYFNWTATDNKGKTQKLICPATLQPIQLWSLVFPKENLDLVLNSLQPDRDAWNKKQNLPMAALRRALGDKKIPEWDKKSITFPIFRKYVQILGIGIREDTENKFGNEHL